MKQARRSITSGNVRDALSTLCGMEDATPLLVPVISRGNKQLFQAALARVPEIPEAAMKHLISHPEMLKIALSKGLDPNTSVGGKIATEIAARKHMYKSLQILFSCPNVKVTRYVINRLKNNTALYTQAIEHAPACREDVVHAIRVRSTALLQRALHKLKTQQQEETDVKVEEKEDDPQTWSDKLWAEKVEDKLKCPILLQATAEPVMTPSNHVFHSQAIHEWVRNHATNPMTRQPLTEQDLVGVGATILGNLLKGVIE